MNDLDYTLANEDRLLAIQERDSLIRLSDQFLRISKLDGIPDEWRNILAKQAAEVLYQAPKTQEKNAVSVQNEQKRQDIINKQIELLLSASKNCRISDIAQISLALITLLDRQRDFSTHNYKIE